MKPNKIMFGNFFTKDILVILLIATVSFIPLGIGMVVYNWDNTPDKFIKRHKWEYGYVVFQQMQRESRGESAQYVLVTKNGDEYDVTGGPHWLPNNNMGYPGLKYLCVYDINNPKSFAIYYDCPILDSIPKFRAIGSIRKIKKTDQIFRIDFEIDSVLINELTFLEGGFVTDSITIGKSKILCPYTDNEYLPMEYLTVCKRLVKENVPLPFDFYPITESQKRSCNSISPVTIQNFVVCIDRGFLDSCNVILNNEISNID